MTTRGWTSLAVLVVLSVSQASQASETVFYVRGSVGIASQSLKDWNDEIKDDEQVVRSAGIPASFDELGAGFPIGLEVGVMITDAISVGAGFNYQKASSDNTYSDFYGSLSTGVDLSVVGIMGSVALWFPGAHGLFLLGEGGVAFGKAESEFHFRIFGDPSKDINVQGVWDGAGPIAGLALGYVHFFAGGTLIFGRLGYRYQNLGELNGDVTSPQLGSASGPPRNNSGRAIDTDFSGVHFLVGFGVRFGGQ